MGIFGNDTADNDTTYYNKATVKLKKKNFQEAIKYYDKALEINPNYVDAWNDKGVALIKLRKYDEGLKCYDKALEINPNYVMSLLNKSNLLSRRFQKYEEAINCFNKIQKLDEKTIKEGIKGSKYTYPDVLVIVLNDKGIAFFKLKNYEEAIDCYKKALEIDPIHTLALNNKKNAEKALNELKNIICPKCGFENRQDSDYCENCSEQLKIDYINCSNCGFKNFEAAKFCIQCGEKLNSTENNIFCLNCNNQIIVKNVIY